MWLGGADIPEALVSAHRSGDLVIFVGAGASMAAPSSLPNFKTLAEEIAVDAGVDVTLGLDLDVLLGRADANQLMDVHRRVALRIDDPTSRPNGLHQAIGALAATGPKIRIVTTNYDRHISTVLEDRQPPEFLGPALPMGDDFDGLVYLHGSLTQEPRHLICTDADFGRAYLRDAWAARFLERMFATYTVLFIGYSHNDLVMTYLARALGPRSRRYALVPDPPGDKWRHLGIQAIGYSLVDPSHSALTRIVAKWASQASMGLLEHRRQVAQVVAVPPSGDPDETSYIESVLADDQRIGFFTEYARDPAWLVWAATRPEFGGLFGEAPANTALARWFVEHFVTDQAHTRAALALVEATGGRLGPTLWAAVGQRLHMWQGQRPDWLGPWLTLLVRDTPASGDEWLDYALVASSWPQDRAAALLLFDHLTEPRAVLQRSLFPDQPPTFDVILRGDPEWLRQAWRDLFRPHLAELACEIIAIADGHLRMAHRLLSVGAAIQRGWDPVSYGRSAIEEHEQDQFPRAVDVIIDAARDCLELLLDGQAGSAYLEAWAASDVPLLRRLAVHGWVRRRDVTATEKLVWLRGTGWLFDRLVWHEIARLIRKTVGEADEGVVTKLVADATSMGDGEVSDYQRYNLLVWITQHAPTHANAHSALAAAQAAHPEYARRDHPDFLSWSESGSRDARFPTSPDEFHLRIEADPASAITDLRRYQDVNVSFDEPSWQDALALVTRTVQRHPTDGLRIVDAAHDDPEIVAATVRGWSVATLDSLDAVRVIERLQGMPMTGIGPEVADMLAHDGQNETTTVWRDVPGAIELARKAWDALDSDAPAKASNDWLTDAINHPAGWLAQFWLDVLTAEWRAAGDSWTGLPTNLSAQFEIMLGGGDDRAAMAQVILAGRIHVLHGADQPWAERVILPLLDWVDEDRARRAWDGFLSWGRWNNRLLEIGLRDHYLETSLRASVFRQDQRRILCAHLAAIAIFGDDNPIVSGWVDTFTRRTSTETRTEWIRQITQLLSELEADAVEHQWTEFLRPYWNARLESRPVQLTEDEASAMAGWTVYFTRSIADAVHMAIQHPAHLDRQSRVLRRLASRIHTAPEQFAKLLVHLLRGTKPPFYEGLKLRELVNALRAAGMDTTPIVEQSVRLGLADAPNW